MPIRNARAHRPSVNEQRSISTALDAKQSETGGENASVCIVKTHRGVCLTELLYSELDRYKHKIVKKINACNNKNNENNGQP